MGLLHAHFLEQAGWHVALLGRPRNRYEENTAAPGVHGANTSSITCGVIPLGRSQPVPLKAQSVTLQEAKHFLRQDQNHNHGHGPNKATQTHVHVAAGVNKTESQHPLRCILCAVKAYDIKNALAPVLEVLGTTQAKVGVDAVVLLHNGLMDPEASTFLDHNSHKVTTMISTNGSTLLSVNERLHQSQSLSYIAKHMGLGSTLLFPHHSHEDDNNDNAGRNNNNNNIALANALHTFQQAMPGTARVVTASEGQCEQYLKLSMNAAINGLLARQALRKWGAASSNKQQTDTQTQTTTTHIPIIIPRLTNGALEPELQLAKNIARLVSWRALGAHPGNTYLQTAVSNDEAATRTEAVYLATSNNICSTVSDLLARRRSERSALLDTAMNEWPQLQFPKGYPSISGYTTMNEHDWNEAASALEEINHLLTMWDGQQL
jgi:ketopantoate reductase